MSMIKIQKLQLLNKGFQYSLDISGKSVWVSYFDGKYGFFRLFDFGLRIKDISDYGLTLLERTGEKKFIRIGKWVINYLPRRNNTPNYKYNSYGAEKYPK